MIRNGLPLTVLCLVLMVLFTGTVYGQAKEYHIGWLMVGDWDSDYPGAPQCLSTHVDKPADWTITYEPIWFSQIVAGECLVSNYDLIVNTGHQTYTFTQEQKMILEEFVRSGGVLWFDDCGNIEIDNLPFGYEINFGYGQYLSWGNAYNSPTHKDFTIPLPDHPLVNGKFMLDIEHIRDDRSSTQWFTPFYAWDNHYEIVMSGTDTTYGYQGPAILAAQVGFGKIVATAMDVTCAMEGYAYGGLPATRFDYHLVYNILAWAKQPVLKNYHITWNSPVSGNQWPQNSLVPLEFTVTDEAGNPVDDNTAYIEVYKDNLLINNSFSIACVNGVYTTTWNTAGLQPGMYTLLADFEGYCSQEPVDTELLEYNPYTEEYKLCLRVASQKYDEVTLTLLENGVYFAGLTIVREDDSPLVQLYCLEGYLDPSKTYNAYITYTPTNPESNGVDYAYLKLYLPARFNNYILLRNDFVLNNPQTWTENINQYM